MKKSQILAALALAFALGVVAPAANAIISSETYAADTTIDSRATLAQVKDAAASARKNKKVDTYMAAVAAVEAATEEKDGTKVVVEPEAALDALNEELAKFINKYTNAETIADALSNLTKVTDYTKWSALIEAVESDDTSVSVDTQISNITKKAQALGYTVTVGNETDNKARLQNVINQAKALTDYDKYNALYEDVEAARTTTNTIAALRSALTGLGKSAAEIDAAEEKGINAANGLVATIEGFPLYNPEAKALYEALEDAKDAEDGNTTGNADLIKAIKEAYKNFTDTDLVITAGAGNTENNPGANPDNKPGTADPTAPDTGILADAEAGASSTVAMVAGIATALTAAGAGVVAYRNARRSTRK